MSFSFTISTVVILFNVSNVKVISAGDLMGNNFILQASLDHFE